VSQIGVRDREGSGFQKLKSGQGLSPDGVLPRPLRCLERMLFSVIFWWILSLVCAAVVAWDARNSLNPDGLSYLDMGSGWLTQGASSLVNGLWSPAYPALIGAVFFLFRPSPELEFTLLHLINVFLFACALWAFSFFLHSWTRLAFGDKTTEQNRIVIPFAYCTFVWFALRVVGTQWITPDLGVVAGVFLAAGIGCRLFLPERSPMWFAALGLTIGAGYCMKAILLPMGMILLAILFFALPHSKNSIRTRVFLSLCLSVTVAAAVASPFVIALSLKEHRFTLGEAGRLNYLWHVNKIPAWVIEANQPNSMAIHPIPVLLDKPHTLEFSSPIQSTFPLGLGGAYWWEGPRTQFHLRQQLAQLKDSLLSYKGFLDSGALAFPCGLLVIWAMDLFGARSRERPAIAWWQVAWGLSSCVVYGLVHTEPRYLSPFLALSCIAIYLPLISPRDGTVSRGIFATVLLSVMIPFVGFVAKAGLEIARDAIRPRRPEYQQIGLGLRSLGLMPGDRLAVVDAGFDSFYDSLYAARYARLRVAALVPNSEEFLDMNSSELHELADRLASKGVRAIITPERPLVSTPARWREIKVSGSTDFNVLLLPARIGQGQ
jgi:hypothetical protein